MEKCFILVWNNRKSQRNILHSPGCALPENSINQDKEGLTKFYSLFAEIFKGLDRVHACPTVAMPQQREECTHHPQSVVVIGTKESDLDEK